MIATEGQYSPTFACFTWNIAYRRESRRQTAMGSGGYPPVSGFHVKQPDLATLDRMDVSRETFCA